MRLITRATLLTIVYTAITSRWFKAYHAIMPYIIKPVFRINGLEMYRWAFYKLLYYVNKPALILSIMLLIATVITGALEDKRDTDFLELS